MAIDEVLLVGRFGVLADFPELETGDLSQAEYEQLGARPKAALYETQDILSLTYGKRGTATVLTQVRLKESVETISREDEFKSEETEQIRVLELLDAGYQQRLFQKDEDGKWAAVKTIIPKMKGKQLQHIPFEVFTPDSNPMKIAKPPILGLAEANIDHYRLDADYKHGLHFTALPTPVFPGLSTSDLKDENGDIQPIKMGSGEAVLIPDPQAKSMMLEFTGAGLKEIASAIQDKKQEMATLGARMISQDKRMAEAAETAQIHRQGENSVLAGVAKSVSASLQRVCQWMLDWAGITGDLSIELNTDFLPASMTSQQLTALTAAVQGGQISYDVFFYNLQKGEIIQEGRTLEDEREAIENSL